MILFKKSINMDLIKYTFQGTVDEQISNRCKNFITKVPVIQAVDLLQKSFLYLTQNTYLLINANIMINSFALNNVSLCYTYTKEHVAFIMYEYLYCFILQDFEKFVKHRPTEGAINLKTNTTLPLLKASLLFLIWCSVLDIFFTSFICC